MDEVFEMIMAADENLEFTIRCSMLEIYNEKIRDLLDSIFLPFTFLRV